MKRESIYGYCVPASLWLLFIRIFFLVCVLVLFILGSRVRVKYLYQSCSNLHVRSRGTLGFRLPLEEKASAALGNAWLALQDARGCRVGGWGGGGFGGD